MEPDEELFAARVEILRIIAIFALAREEDAERLDAVRALTTARATEIQKVVRGMSHRDPKERSFWIEEFGHRTPAESFRLIERLPNPPGQKGRPRGTGYEEADLQLMPEIHRRVTLGEDLRSVTEDLAIQKRAEGAGTVSSIGERLQKFYRKWAAAGE